MAYTTQRTWTTGDDITAARLNTYLRDDVGFLATPPSCRVYNNANISHSSSGSNQYLTFNTERFDTDTMHSTSVNTGRITFTTAGKYLVGGNITFAANSTGQRGVHVRLNGTTVIANYGCETVAGGLETPLFVVGYYAFSASDYIELGCLQNSGGALNVLASGNYSPEFWAVWQSL